MKIDRLWATPIAEFQVPMPEEMRRALVAVLLRKEKESHRAAAAAPEFERLRREKKLQATTHYNLFTEADRHPEREDIVEFERLACGLFRNYLREAYSIEQANELKLGGRCFGNVQLPGARTFPHYHHGVDGELVHYLQIEDGPDPQAHISDRHGSHALLLMDPRGTPSFPYWEKVHSIFPRQGLTVIHPSYVWHETNVWRGEHPRVCIVVNFQVLSHGNAALHEPLRF